jgi:RNA polymerase sigma factor (sigma-70 family)
MRAPFAAFESVYQRELPFVWAAARRLGVHPAVIDDAVQDVFLTAYRRWGDLHHDVSPRAWLYGVTRRVAFRYRRSHARTVRRKAAVASDTAGRSTAPHRERDEAHDVDAVLAVLEPGRREVFVMSELLEMTAPEIASQLEIPVNTVYSRLRLARRDLEPRLRRGVAVWAGSVRRREQPSSEQAQRTWAVLLPLLEGAPGGGLIGAWTLGRVLGVVAAVGVVTSAAIAGGRPERGETREDRAVEATAGARHERGRSAAPAAEPAAELGGAALEATPEVDPGAALVPMPGDAKQPESARPSPRAPTPSSELAAREPAAVDPPLPGLEEEVAVLDRATAALREGDAAHALQWLAEHERRFPSGRLTDVRKASRVRALCRLGREAQAHAEAVALRRDHPQSTVAQRTPIDCEDA